MGEDAGSGGKELTDGLSAEELRLLHNALKVVERRLFDGVLKQLKTWVIVAAGAVTVFGVASMTTLREAIVTTASTKLSADAALREAVVTQCSQRLPGVDELVKKAAELDKTLEAERVKALALVGSDLQRMLQMIEQLQTDAESLRRRKK